MYPPQLFFFGYHQRLDTGLPKPSLRCSRPPLMFLQLNSRPLFKDLQALQCFSRGLGKKSIYTYGTEPKLKSHTIKPDV